MLVKCVLPGWHKAEMPCHKILFRMIDLLITRAELRDIKNLTARNLS